MPIPTSVGTGSESVSTVYNSRFRDSSTQCDNTMKGPAAIYFITTVTARGEKTAVYWVGFGWGEPTERRSQNYRQVSFPVRAAMKPVPFSGRRREKICHQVI